MRMTKLGKAIFSALRAVSPVLAEDSAVPALVGSATRGNFKTADVTPKLLALDASLDSNKLDAVLDAILDVEQDPETPENPKAQDGSPVDQLRALLAGKVDDSVLEQACQLFAEPAKDADMGDTDKKDDRMKKEDVKAAMDSLRHSLREAEEARRDVRAVVGDVLSMDSAADVYGFALDHLKIDRKDVDGVPALRALFKVAVSKQSVAPIVAADSSALHKRFPNLSRFRNV